MQINSRLRSILSLPWVYRLFAHILGIEANRQWFLDDVLACATAKNSSMWGVALPTSWIVCQG
jgi:hypothetical protein